MSEFRGRTASVVVAADDPLARAFTVSLLDRNPLRVVAEAGRGREITLAARTHKVDLIVSDSWLPGGNVFGAIAAAKRFSPSTKVLLLNRDFDPQPSTHAQECGIEYFLRKSDAMEHLRASALFAAGVGPADSPDASHAELSPREVQVANLVVAGHNNPEIADMVGVSASTVKTYTSRLYAKLGVGNRVQLNNLLRDNPQFLSRSAA